MRLQLGLELAADTAVVLAATAAVLVFLDYALRLERSTRLAVLAASLAAVVGLLAARAWRRWRAVSLDELSLAMTLDRYRPGTGQQIADVLQLPDLLDEARRRRPRRRWCGWPSSRRARRWRHRTGGRSGTRDGRPCTRGPCCCGLLVPVAFATVGAPTRRG